MNLLMKSTLCVAALLSSLTIAQLPCDSAGYDSCQAAIVSFGVETCGPFLAKNATLHQDCICYQLTNQVNCYALCASNATLQSELVGVKSSQANQCSIAGLNPLALPNPPPWQTVFITATPTTTAVSAKNTSAPAASGTTSTTPAAAKNDVLTMGASMILGLVALALQIV